MICKGKIPREEGFLRRFHVSEKGAWKFLGGYILDFVQ